MFCCRIEETDTTTVPNATPTGGSCGTDLNGKAVIAACEQLAALLEPLRAARPDDTWQQIVQRAYQERTQLAAFGFYNTSPLDYDMETNEGSMFNYLTYGAGCSLVEVDCLTGEHTLLRTDIVMDVGRSLNPAIDVGQIEGAFLQGWGYMTLEELLHYPDGSIANPSLSSYKLPGVRDIPQQLHVTLLRTPGTRQESVYSSKGVGEPPLTLAVSVVCAIRQAVESYRTECGQPGLWELSIPLTSHQVRTACRDEIMQAVTADPDLVPTKQSYLNILQ